MRWNTALPDWNSLRASSSWEVLNPGARQPDSRASDSHWVTSVAMSTSKSTSVWSSLYSSPPALQYSSSQFTTKPS